MANINDDLGEIDANLQNRKTRPQSSIYKQNRKLV